MALLLIAFGILQGCTPNPPEQASVSISEWNACLSKDRDRGFVLNRDLFPESDSGRFEVGDHIRFTALGDGYSAWQTVTRLADTANESWRFISDHEKADVLFVSLDGKRPRLGSDIEDGLRSFGINDDLRHYIIDRALSIEPDAILYFGVEGRAQRDGRYRKIIMTREETPYTNRLGIHTFAAAAAVGGPKDFDVLLSCRGELIPSQILPPRPTDEGRALFKAMLTL